MKLAWGRRSKTSSPVTSGGMRNSHGNQTHWREETGRQKGLTADGRAAGGERAEGLPDAPAGGRRRQRGGSVARSNAPAGGMPCCAEEAPERKERRGVAHCKRRCASTTTRIPDEPLLVIDEPKRWNKQPEGMAVTLAWAAVRDEDTRHLRR